MDKKQMTQLDAPTFEYEEAFSRTLGWVTEEEQRQLQSKRIAIAGLGGVGGSYLLTLTRLGIGQFNISDLDAFELCNFNRQAGATMASIGKLKVYELEDRALEINPELKINTFSDGVTTDNLDAFLEDVDLYVDGLDTFAVEIREQIYKRCYELKIPVISAAPIGMGTSMIVFTPESMPYHKYFGWQSQSPMDKIRLFLAGIAPSPNAARYLVNPSQLSLSNKKVISTPMGIDLCTGVICTVALKLLLKRGPVVVAPRTLHFDAYLNTFKVVWRPFGFKNPLQKLAYRLIKKL